MTVDVADPTPGPAERLALAELLDRALHKGIVLRGDLVISMAGVDLLFVDVKALIASVETAAGIGAGPAAGDRIGLSLRVD